MEFRNGGVAPEICSVSNGSVERRSSERSRWERWKWRRQLRGGRRRDVGAGSEMSVPAVMTCSSLRELWIRDNNRGGEVHGLDLAAAGGRDMGVVHDFRIGVVQSVGWIDWLQVVRSGSDRVAYFRSSVSYTEATLRCNIDIQYIYIFT
jgi:hypothetical protein